MEGNNLSVDETEKDLGIMDIIWYEMFGPICLYALNKDSKVMGMIKRTIKYKEAGIMLIVRNS